MTVRPIDANAPPIRDLSDFCLKWPELRSIVLAREREGLAAEDPELQVVLRWLRLLADSVCRDETG